MKRINPFLLITRVRDSSSKTNFTLHNFGPFTFSINYTSTLSIIENSRMFQRVMSSASSMATWLSMPSLKSDREQCITHLIAPPRCFKKSPEQAWEAVAGGTGIHGFSGNFSISLWCFYISDWEWTHMIVSSLLPLYATECLFWILLANFIWILSVTTLLWTAYKSWRALVRT